MLGAMANPPWITIVGIGADGIAGLPPASQAALAGAEVVMAPPRHLEMITDQTVEKIAWPVPFLEGLQVLEGLRGRQVVVLASGDPFWFGAGASIARHFAPEDWICLTAPSTFSRVAARLGWSLTQTTCLGLHAAPLSQMRPHLAQGVRLIVLLRDGNAPHELATYLTELGFGASRLTILEAVGSEAERATEATAQTLDGDFAHPVCAAIEVSGPGASLSSASGQPDDLFETDGQITKRPIRALTLSALAPRAGERLWDIGGGSGSIAIEWLLANSTTTATTFEPRADRAKRILRNAKAMGVAQRLSIVNGGAPEALEGAAQPDAIFIGGGLTDEVIKMCHAQRARIVANVVTLEGEAALSRAQAAFGGSLMRIELAHAEPLGPKTGWKSSYPVVQWSFAP